MKKALRKAGAVVCLVSMMSVSLAGCAKKKECEICGEKKMCNKYEVSLMGESESGWFCKDCYKEMKSTVEAWGGTIKKK